jgi:hypothetical protein
MAVATRSDPEAEDLRYAGERVDSADRVLLEKMRKRLAHEEWRTAYLREKLEPSCVVAVRMREEHAVDLADAGHIRPQPRLGAIAKVEQHTPTFRFQQKARRPFRPAAGYSR